MSDSVPKKIESGVRRVLGGVFGLVLGLVVGLVAGLLLVGFGDALLVTIGACGVGLAVVCFIWPGPILFVMEIVLNPLGIEF